MYALELKNFSLSVGKGKQKKTLLSELSIHLNTQDWVHLVGPNGSGKSSFIKSLLGLRVNGISGEWTFFDEKLSNSILKKIGYVPESFPVDQMHSFASFASILSSKKRSKKQILEQINGLSEQLGLEVSQDQNFKGFSKGMKQKTKIVLSLLDDPKFMIWDEPYSGLDVASVKKLNEFMLNNCKDKTWIVTSHLGELIEVPSHKKWIIDDLNIREEK